MARTGPASENLNLASTRPSVEGRRSNQWCLAAQPPHLWPDLQTVTFVPRVSFHCCWFPFLFTVCLVLSHRLYGDRRGWVCALYSHWSWPCSQRWEGEEEVDFWLICQALSEFHFLFCSSLLCQGVFPGLPWPCLSPRAGSRKLERPSFGKKVKQLVEVAAVPFPPSPLVLHPYIISAVIDCLLVCDWV